MPLSGRLIIKSHLYDRNDSTLRLSCCGNCFLISGTSVPPNERATNKLGCQARLVNCIFILILLLSFPLFFLNEGWCRVRRVSITPSNWIARPLLYRHCLLAGPAVSYSTDTEIDKPRSHRALLSLRLKRFSICTCTAICE